MAEAALALEQAIAWHVRLPELSGSEWAEFVDWLESHESHRTAFDSVASADHFVADGIARSAPEKATPWADTAAPAAPRWGRRMTNKPWWGAAAAACLVAVAGWSLWPAQSDPRIERTAPGTVKQLAFADGTKVDLNGGSVLTVDQANPREARLDEGEARFSVQHHERPFTLQAGGFVIRDLGTVFDVQLTPRTLQVLVREGSVGFDPQGVNLVLAAGERVVVDRDSNVVVRDRVDRPADWMRGELAFQNVPLADVVQSIHRRSGANISLSEGLSDRLFTGNIHLTGKEDTDVAHFAGLIGAGYRRDGAVWVISDAGTSP